VCPVGIFNNNNGIIGRDVSLIEDEGLFFGAGPFMF